MQLSKLRQITKLCLSSVFLAGAMYAAAAIPDMRLSGLALHLETGRDIYLGGIYFDQHVPKPDDLVKASGPKLMEYRVVARRTSIRSLLGGILLQSELASGQRPDDNVSSFAKDILSRVKGSLYAGDSFQIMLNENDETIAYLNGHELTRVDDGAVSDYILMGWVGAKGPSTAFRNSILADEIAPAMWSTFEANSFSAKRGGEVAAWLGAPDQREAASAAAEELAPVLALSVEAVVAATAEMPAETPAGENPELLAASTVTIETIASSAAEPMLAQPEPRLGEHDSIGDSAEAAIEDGTRVASLTPVSGLFSPPQPEGIAALSVRDYSKRLGIFNTNLIKRVYGEIHYPARAVRRSIQGRLELDVTLAQDGTLVGVAVAQSSGYKILDRAAVKAATRALSAADPTNLDPVAVAEYGGSYGELIVPVPVQFLLTE